MMVVACGGTATRNQTGTGGTGGEDNDTTTSNSDSTSSSTSSSTSGSGGSATSTTATGGSDTSSASATTGSGGTSTCGGMCDEPTCPDGELVVPEGECCPECSCAAVSCVTSDCAPDEVWVIHPGACCPSCEPILACESDDDCIVADRPRSCCGCPEVINRAALDDDPCWYDVDAPRELPNECYPEEYCDAVCGACAPIDGVLCVAGRCEEAICIDFCE